MTSNTIAKGLLKAVAVLVAVVLAFYFLWLIQSVIIYLAVSLILTLIGMPIVKFLKTKCKFKNIFAVITTLLIFVGFIFGFIMMFVPLIASQGHNLSLLNTAAIEQNITQLIEQASNWLESHNIDSNRLLKESNLSSKLNFNFIPNFLNIILGTISSFGVGLASVLFITFFFLKDRKLFSNSTQMLLPQNHKEKILNSLDKIDHLLSRYFIGLVIQLTIIFVLYLVVLLIFGVQNALIIAFLCAILNIIPYVGPLIGSILAALLTMLSNLGSDFQSEILPTTIYVLIGFWVVQVIDNNLTGPLIFSNSVNSHPLEIFLVILIAGFLFGILGMVIAVPMYTILKVIAKEFFPENRIVQLLTRKI
ncbi:AI-2E family transporter [Flavobacterium selenitireducens]|uniref:AI-2E family transporter n=1 Tax=Flavobacterium selenitireducens TaxID=2722704 RepID=UPI00168B8DCC|nr:AI-2E family transporter [Flavobacterium selenitireducens]MBD3580945.1 AI-2E family transporter [Flavobacterium selenitireducens]